ncbi:hypothetical protein SCUCBS95973_001647 [Sporothrix curviconia]|uniref:Uncharacterized protein n=1 Tax=Sporothrix curviconia TaxID=1260050 RepID=A0ABP0B0D7_9PEZI
MTPASIRDVLDINLYGTILGCRAALRAWAREPIQDRCIVNMSSLLAVQGGYGASAYAASKAGVVALTRSLVDEGKSRQIRANVILPGYIESSMTDSITDAARADLIDRIPLRRFGLTDEVADAALFLVRNKYANNCSLNLDGGLSVAG